MSLRPTFSSTFQTAIMVGRLSNESVTMTIIQDLSCHTYSGNGFRLWFTRKLDSSKAIWSWCDHCHKVRFLNYTAIATSFLSSSEGINNPIYSGIYCPVWDAILRNNTVRDWRGLPSALTAGSKKQESKFLKQARKCVRK
jgi:hypothetical protein